MSEGLKMLDQVLDMARKELLLIKAENFAEASEVAEARTALLESAWNYRNEGIDDTTWRDKLLELAGLQQELQALTQSAYDLTKASLQHTKKEKKRIVAYHKSVTQALEPSRRSQ